MTHLPTCNNLQRLPSNPCPFVAKTRPQRDIGTFCFLPQIFIHECKTVTLRTSQLKERMLSFYLDYYPGYRNKVTIKVIRHETQGIYL